MKIICTVEGCGHLSENRDIGLCATHAREARKRAAPKAKPARKASISKNSDPERQAIYHAIQALWRPQNELCERCWEPSHEPHHREGKLGDLLYDVRKWMPVCRKCHRYIEDHPQEAYEKGWSLLRNANEPHEI